MQKKNKKKSKKKSSSDTSFTSLPTNLEESSNKSTSNDGCENLTDSVTGECTQPTAQTMTNNSSNAPAKRDLKDGESPSSIHVRDVPHKEDKNKRKAKDEKPKETNTEGFLDSTKTEDFKFMATSFANLEIISDCKKESSKHEKIVDQFKEIKLSDSATDIPNEHKLKMVELGTDPTTKISTTKEENNNCAQPNTDNENKNDGKVCKTESTTMRNNNTSDEKETDQRTKDSPSDLSNASLQKDSIQKIAQQKGDTKGNNEDVKVGYCRVLLNLCVFVVPSCFLGF